MTFCSIIQYNKNKSIKFRGKQMVKIKDDVYEIMHQDRRVARIDKTGHCKIYFKSFMPYNLYLEEEEDIDTLVNNITNFYYWC